MKIKRLPIVLLAMFCLLSGIWSGLNRVGWNLYVTPAIAHHGAMMVGGFLGTLIALEKIIPMKRGFLYSIPVMNALSVLFFFTGHPQISVGVLIVSGIALSLVFIYYFRIQQSIIFILMLAGSLCWLIGNILLLTSQFYPLVFPWWVAFALFIIVAERLDLTRFLPVSRREKSLVPVLLFLFVAGVFLSFHGSGNLVCGFSLIGISVWLLRYDLIALNMKKTGMPKYIAIALLTGYISLLLTGVLFFTLSDQWLTYDALVHSFFIGFVFSMIFAHGPMILPGIMGINAAPFHPILYAWLALLQVSWLIRLFADVLIDMEIRRISGLLSAAAILGYFATMAVLTIRSSKADKRKFQY
jgi:hypothetical protein